MEMHALRRDGSEFPVELTISAVRMGGDWTFIGFLRDQTHEKQAQGRLQVQIALFRLLAESPTLAAIESTLLEAMCKLDPWLFGACWRLDGGRLRCVAWRQCQGHAFPEFRARTLDLALRPGEGLPGRVWEAKAPIWIADLEGDQGPMPRIEAARREGLVAAFALPVIVRGETALVFEFFSRQAREPDAELIAFASSLGGQLGVYLERKAAEEEVETNQRRFQALMEASNDVVAIVLPDGRVDYVSESMLRILGYTGKEYVGRNSFDDIHPEDLGQGPGDIRPRPVPAGRLGRTRTARPAQGRLLALDRSHGHQHDPRARHRGVLANLREITERRRAQQEREALLGQLREERERLSAILDFTPIPIVLLDPGSARLIFANKAAHQPGGRRIPDRPHLRGIPPGPVRRRQERAPPGAGGGPQHPGGPGRDPDRRGGHLERGRHPAESRSSTAPPCAARTENPRPWSSPTRTSPISSRWRPSSAKARRWRPSASWPAASPTTSTTCSPPSTATAPWPWRSWPRTIPCTIS